MEKIEIKKLNEVVYYEKLDNGLDVYIYNKPGFNKKGAYFTTKYGSANNEFSINDEDVKSYPLGIAHFLEHKLFESNDDESTFLKFEKCGATVNAYTNHTETCYYFTTSENFYECLNLLLDFVQSPHFTLENVEKEKGIINQEIDMSSDNINRFIYEKLFENSLVNNPNKYKTIGDKENVGRITKEELYECYNTFYNPSNMILTIAGDLEPEKVIEEIKRNQKKKSFNTDVKITLKEYDEPNEVLVKYEEIKRNVVSPRTAISYKFVFDKDKIDFENMISMLLDLKIGVITGFNTKLVQDNIIKSYPSFSMNLFDNVLLLTASADTIDKDKFIKIVDETLKDKNFKQDDFELIKKSYISNLVRGYESPVAVANTIYKDIIKYGRFLNDIYERLENYDYDKFIKDVKKLDFSNKSVIYITKEKEE